MPGGPHSSSLQAQLSSRPVTVNPDLSPTSMPKFLICQCQTRLMEQVSRLSPVALDSKLVLGSWVSGFQRRTPIHPSTRPTLRLHSSIHMPRLQNYLGSRPPSTADQHLETGCQARPHKPRIPVCLSTRLVPTATGSRPAPMEPGSRPIPAPE